MARRTSVAGLSLRDLEYIQSIAEEGHFGRAADICGVSQPAISQQVLKLEARLGFSIFERQGRHVSLTQNGRIVLQKAEILLSEARELLELSLSLSDNLEGDLKFGVLPTLGPYLLPLILKSLKAAYPKLRLSLFEEPTHVLEEMLTNRALDAALIATNPKQPALSALELFHEPFVFACPKDLDLKPNEKVRWSKVLSSQLVLLSQEHCLRDQTVAFCDRIDRPGQRVASSLEMLRQMVALGEGCALFPALSVSGPDRFGGLATTHPIADGVFGRSIRLAWRDSDPRTGSLEHFGTFIQTLMAAPEMARYLNGKA
ncbi:hydrogen peroxide-inducible genes activator [Ruegeria arenilitoris]|uniref:hydrogen peroxide-inducible genes activator n=1 Tax=Ruegeria arenilitoris TaxID=1173585 RepID=UPI00147E2450|nr:hydrogen peroxide-inducible genes activator [Ruegeria arenilitoris]